ncbi:helix-turn-helix domain-containing protein [Massilia phyllosphaerae]|uniref:helix-turn-helix domain-containing protein n=1 Tax=Massilia phyllosphaerae TaxID=3106034 RepID=UPI002B1CC26F|nr:helix-turn-helix domain-containing protein [Massilia sp. SGZ-792]
MSFPTDLPRPGRHMSNATKVAMRADAIRRITELLSKAPLSVVDLARVLKINSNTVYGYLRYMAEMGDVRRSGEVDAQKREQWELGPEDPARLQSQEARPHGGVVVPARQMGMKRHPQDVAFFGPARGGEA